jgi:hypothetical protein
MAAANGAAAAAPRAGEETPLLAERTTAGSDAGASSSETLLSDPRGDEEQQVDRNQANQQVGRTRGLLIILSLWGLIFLQGKSLRSLVLFCFASFFYFWMYILVMS